MAERFLASVLPQHEAAELYRLMVVGIRGVAVFLMDPQGYITVWNRAAEEMKGFTADDAIGQHLGLLYTDPDREAGKPDLNLARATRMGVFSEETWRRRKDGSLFWAHIVLTALRDPEERLVGFSKVTMDLTRHKELEQCTKEKEEINLILRAAEAGTWKWHVDNDEVEVSGHLLQLLGYESKGRTLDFKCWLSFIHREERQHFRHQLELLRDQGHGLGAVETQVRILTRERDYRWFFLRVNWHRDDDHAPLLVMGVCVEVSALKAAEEQTAALLRELTTERTRFANILEQLPSGIMLAESPSGRVTYANRAAGRLLGRQMSELNTYQDYSSLRFTDAQGERVAPEALPLARTVLNQEASTTDELVYERDDGTRLHFAVTSSLISDDDGVARLAVAVFHDVSSLKRAELSAATERERALVTLAAITDGVITADQSGRITSLNPAAERMTGLSNAEGRGAPLRDVLHFAEDGGQQSIDRAVDRCLREKRVVDNLPHLTLVNRGGQQFAVDSAVAPITLGDGTLLGAVMVFHDVTESKRLMRRLGLRGQPRRTHRTGEPARIRNAPHARH